MPERRFFLGVRQSANGLSWFPRLDERGERTALAAAQSLGISEAIARVLAGRGVTLEACAGFLHPTLRDLLPDPASLTDMDKAASRLADAVLACETVAIFGDYDVDGAASSTLLQRFLRHYGVSSEIYIPDRIFEGYGPNPAAMTQLASRARLIVTVDCGTNSSEAIRAAVDGGAEVVVLDHHQVSGALPPAVAIVNPNRDDDLSGQGHLCAAGVVFLTLVRTRRILHGRAPDLPPLDLLILLDLVALATVCDVVPLAGVNRAFVRRGLEVLARGGNKGLAALSRVSRLTEAASAHHLGFLLGPRINAGGRIGDAALGSRLLATEDEGEAERISAKLEELNRERQELEAAMLEEARAEADAEMRGGDGPAVLVTGSERWHPGVVGLLASRLKDHARRPAFAIAFRPDGLGTGSGRSISGFDLGRLVQRALEGGLLEKGGGHAMAAGITVRREKLGALRAFFEAEAADAVTRLRGDEALMVDAALSAEGATLGLLDEIERAGPYGPGHAAPVFVLPRHRAAEIRPVGANHLQVRLASPGGGSIRAMAFRAAGSDLGRFLEQQAGRPIHVAGSLTVNHWNGTRSAQFRIVDAAPAI